MITRTRGQLLWRLTLGIGTVSAGGVLKVQEAYRYAVDNAAPLQYIPCFCG